jgi:hypothetical protein
MAEAVGFLTLFPSSEPSPVSCTPVLWASRLAGHVFGMVGGLQRRWVGHGRGGRRAEPCPAVMPTHCVSLSGGQDIPEIPARRGQPGNGGQG